MIKAIYLDIDGTMVSFNTHRMSDATRFALMEAKRNGIKIFVATGRHDNDINNLGDMVFNGYITLNGAYCRTTGNVIFKRCIPQSDVESFIRYNETVERIPCFFVEADSVTANGKFDIIDRMIALVEFAPRPIMPLRYFIDKEILQITAFFPVEKEPEIMSLLPGCSSSRWFPTFTDINPLGIDKSVGIEKMNALYGITQEETMAFGDGGNDISMIRYAGIGVAMGNAEEKVKQSADYVTSSVDDDGIGAALRHFGIIE